MFDPTSFTGFHTWLSLIALATGLVTVAGLLGSRRRPGWTAAFLATAVATSVTGYGFPPGDAVSPAQIVGAVALLILAVALLARYGARLAGRWRAAYAIAIVASEYLLAFVGVAQSFQKIPALAATAPAGFAVAQLAVLAGFVVLGVLAVRRFHPPAPLMPPLGKVA
ncbi:MAG TPA: hypothetical protein VIL69_00390 [Roseomonas sp.]|jgi:hypothetical protein